MTVQSTAPGAPRPGRGWLRSARRIAIVLVVLYALVLVGAWAFQRDLIYHPVALAGPIQQPGRSAGEVVSFPSGDGVRITALYAPPRDEGAPVVLVAHGNEGNLLTWRGFLDPFRALGLGTFLLDPRGYGWSEGSPSEEGWHRDGEASLAWLASHGTPPSRVIVVGVSLGSGLAVPLAADHPVLALLLESPFTSLVDAASDAFPFLPCAWILRDRFDNLAAAPRVRCPVLILHGTADRTIRPDHSRRLAAAFPTPATLRLVEGADHNDLTAWPGYDDALTAFLRSLP